MGNLPKVTVTFSTDNLLKDIPNLDGVAGLVGTGTTSELLGVPKTVVNLGDAVSQGFTQEDEPSMYRHLKEFYDQIGGNQELNIMIVPDTMTLAEMLDDTNANGAKKLLSYALGKIRLLAVFRTPAEDYDGGEDFIDSDVAAAITSSKTFGDARLAELLPIRMLIEGRVQNPSAPNTLTPNESSNGYSGVVLGGSLNDGSASVGMALGRAVKYGAQVKIGKVINGPLNVNQIYIGDKLLKDVSTLDTLHGLGFISFMTHSQKAGFYFGIDRMCATNDFRLLAYGRVVDKGCLIAVLVYTDEIEDEADLDAQGHLDTDEIIHLEEKIKQNINVAMGAQISGVEAYINPSDDVETTSKVKLKLRIKPKGYKSFIDVDLGLN